MPAGHKPGLENTHPLPAQTGNSRQVQRILIAILAINLLVSGAKLVVGWLIGSLSMVADGFHSLTDALSNVVGLVGTAVAARPPDESHPYGHHKFETLAALIIGGLLAITAWEVFQAAVERWRTGAAPSATPLGFTVMLVTMAVNLAVTTYEQRKGRELHSQVLLADAMHTRSDVYASLAVIFSLVAARLGYPRVDIVVALLITAAIVRAAYQIVRHSTDALVDAAFIPSDQVRRVAESVPGVQSVHKIRTRGRPGASYADLHVQVRPDLRLDQAHVIGHMVSDRLREELGLHDVVVHVEPLVGHRTDWHPEDETNQAPEEAQNHEPS